MKTRVTTYGMTLIFILTISLSSCKKEDDQILVGDPPTLEERIQKKMDNITSAGSGKGLSVAVLLPDGEMLRFASGISHRDVEINSDMVFSAGSITKMFTAACILQYVEEGLISLDDSIYHWFDPHENIDGTINIRQLLNHSCGIYNLTRNDEFWNQIFSNPGSMFNTEEMVRQYTLEPYFEKGTDWAYSNTGYLILRIIMEKISGRSVAQEYRSRLLNPLQLSNTYTAVEEELPLNAAYGWYDLNGDGAYDEMSAEYLKSFYSSADGGIFCTAEDLALWARELLIDKSVLGQEMMNEMLSLNGPCPGEYMVGQYGLGICGFEPALFNGHDIIGHGGNPIGYAAGCFYLPEHDLVIAVMDNTEEGESMWVINEILDVVIDHLN